MVSSDPYTGAAAIIRVIHIRTIYDLTPGSPFNFDPISLYYIELIKTMDNYHSHKRYLFLVMSITCAMLISFLGHLSANEQNFIAISNPADGAQVPNNFKSFIVTWNGPASYSAWKVIFEIGTGRVTIPSDSNSLTVERDLVNRIRSAHGRSARITVCGVTPPGDCSSPVNIAVSPDDFEGNIVYRLVEPLFNLAQPSRIEQLDKDTGKMKIILEEGSVCIGCHAFSSKGLLSLNVKKNKDRRLFIFDVSHSGKTLLHDVKKIGEFSFMAWSPDSKYLALMLNSFGVIDIKKDIAVPFDLVYKSGDIAVYDPGSKQIHLLPGASELDYVEDMPAWSPDGKNLLFVRYQVDDSLTTRDMGIFEVPFRDGKGGTPARRVSAVPGEYNYFPTYSPDGKWISFVKGTSSKGVFAQVSSDIYIMPSRGGAPKRLLSNVGNAMDSWHRWSRNSKWILYSSKRNSMITALLVTHIDRNGNASPPLEIASHENTKVNVPEITVDRFFNSQLSHDLNRSIINAYLK